MTADAFLVSHYWGRGTAGIYWVEAGRDPISEVEQNPSAMHLDSEKPLFLLMELFLRS